MHNQITIGIFLQTTGVIVSYFFTKKKYLDHIFFTLQIDRLTIGILPDLNTALWFFIRMRIFLELVYTLDLNFLASFLLFHSKHIHRVEKLHNSKFDFFAKLNFEARKKILSAKNTGVVLVPACQIPIVNLKHYFCFSMRQPSKNLFYFANTNGAELGWHPS